MVRIGTAGWTIPRSAAELVPGEGSHMHRYARRLRCAEINATFYKLPRVSTWERWAATVPEDFRFAVKAPRAITHEGKLIAGPAPLQEFLASAGVLGAKLGPVLFQLPPKLAYEPGVASEFFGLLRELYAGKAVLEPRHASWFTAEVAELLHEYRVARVAADPARVPAAARPGGWGGLLYYRLHGSPRTYYTAYTEEYLAGLAREIAGREAWVIFDNTASGAALGNALELARMVGDQDRQA